eukprot:scaffold18037_cov16-Prasinocladus_malaysianus.AAC.1
MDNGTHAWSLESFQMLSRCKNVSSDFCTACGSSQFKCLVPYFGATAVIHNSALRLCCHGLLLVLFISNKEHLILQMMHDGNARRANIRHGQ